MTGATQSKRDVWIEAGVVWAAAEGALADSAHQDLTQRAVAMAAGSGTVEWRLLLAYRRANLTADVLALSRHAELLSRLGLPEGARTAMLCRQRSTNFVFWERVLRARGHEVSVFTDGEAALSWLHRPNTGDAADANPEAPAATDVDTVKRLLQRFATERLGAPRSQVLADLTALVECLFAQADHLGIDLSQGSELQERRQRLPSSR
ncbi:MAG: hypothetical protein JSR15_11160 [Proteobacteria bacterium]|nr:hypothetical protein [Pseudomonadota bacterium]